MSVCLGCVLALGSFGFVSGLGRVVQAVAGFRRDRAIARVLSETGPAVSQATTLPRARVAAAMLIVGGCGGGAADAGFRADTPATKADPARQQAGASETVALAPSASFERPRVMVIRADWCGACKRVEPVLKQALLRYEGRFDVVILDVTDDDAIERSARRAEDAGLLDAFTAAGNRTPTVLVARASDKIARPQGSLLEADTFVRAFDDALAAAP